MPRPNAHPYYLRLLRNILSFKFNGTHFIPAAERGALAFGGIKVSSTTISELFGKKRTNFSENTLNQLVLAVGTRHKKWAEFVIAERGHISGQDDLLMIDGMAGKLYTALNAKESKCADRLLKVRTRAWEEGLRAQKTVPAPEPFTGLSDHGFIIYPEDYPQKRGKYYSEQLFQICRKKLGMIQINLNGPDLIKSYEKAETELFKAILLLFEQWTRQISTHPHPEVLGINGEFFRLSPPVEGSCLEMIFLNDFGISTIKKTKTRLYTLERQIPAIGAIRSVIFRVPDLTNVVNHYEVLIDTLQDFLLYMYNLFEARVRDKFVGVKTEYINGIYDLLEAETSHLGFSTELSDRFYLSVTRAGSPKNAIASYHVNKVLVGKMLDKFKRHDTQPFGPFELFVKFLTREFPDEAWHKYGNILNDGYNIPFDILTQIHLHNPNARPIVLGERILHSDDKNNKLHVKTIAQYGELLLQVNTSPYLQAYFDRVAAGIAVEIEELFKANIISYNLG